MFEKGLFPKQGQETRFTGRQIAEATRIVRSYAARVARGDMRAFPLPLFEALQASTPQPAVEAMIMNGQTGESYALHRRPANEKHFGPNKLHITGGFFKPNRRGVNAVSAARIMAQKEMGLQDIEYVAGPIAIYQWKRGIEHPTGWPNSQVYVFKTVGEIPKRDDTVWFSNDELPSRNEMIIDRAGELHLDFIKVYQDWVKNPNQPCRDLNERPIRKDE